jgi:hypothetical protein
VLLFWTLGGSQVGKAAIIGWPLPLPTHRVSALRFGKPVADE